MAQVVPDLSKLVDEAPYVLVRPLKDSRGRVRLGRVAKTGPDGTSFLFLEYSPLTQSRATTKDGELVPEEPFEAANQHRMSATRIFLAKKEIVELAELYKNHPVLLQTLRDLAIIKPPIRIWKREIEYDLHRIEVVNGLTVMSRRFDVLPLEGAEDEIVPLHELAHVKLWVKEEGEAPKAPLATAPSTIQHQVTVYQRPDFIRAEDGSRRQRVTLAEGKPIPETATAILRSATWAGTSNQPRLLILKNKIVLLDPAWWFCVCPQITASPHCDRTDPEEFALQVKECLEALFILELAEEFSAVSKKAAKASSNQDAKDKDAATGLRWRKVESLIWEISFLAEIFATGVGSGLPEEKIEDFIKVLRSNLFRLLGWKKDGYPEENPRSENLVCPPWYFWRKNPVGHIAKKDDDGNILM